MSVHRLEVSRNCCYINGEKSRQSIFPGDFYRGNEFGLASLDVTQSSWFYYKIRAKLSRGGSQHSFFSQTGLVYQLPVSPYFISYFEGMDFGAQCVFCCTNRRQK